NSYLWINSYDLDIVLYPTDPALEGGSLAGVETVERQASIARVYGAGFNTDQFRRPDAEAGTVSPQVSYVRDLGAWDWYIGSAEFFDDFEASVRDELLEVV